MMDSLDSSQSKSRTIGKVAVCDAIMAASVQREYFRKINEMVEREMINLKGDSPVDERNKVVSEMKRNLNLYCEEIKQCWELTVNQILTRILKSVDHTEEKEPSEQLILKGPVSDGPKVTKVEIQDCVEDFNKNCANDIDIEKQNVIKLISPFAEYLREYGLIGYVQTYSPGLNNCPNCGQKFRSVVTLEKPEYGNVFEIVSHGIGGNRFDAELEAIGLAEDIFLWEKPCFVGQTLRSPVEIFSKLKESLTSPLPTSVDLQSARYFMMKSKSVKHLQCSIQCENWSSTVEGNQLLCSIYHENYENGGDSPIYLLFYLDAFICGVALMSSTMLQGECSSFNFDPNHKWRGFFSVKWLCVKSVPITELRHIDLNRNPSYPVIKGRDAQEIDPEVGKEMLNIILNYPYESSVLDEFDPAPKPMALVYNSSPPSSVSAVSLDL